MMRIAPLAALIVAASPWMASAQNAQGTGRDQTNQNQAGQANPNAGAQGTGRQANQNQAGQANPNAGTQGTQGRGAEGGMNDSVFAMAAAADGMAEVAVARLATQRAESDDIRKFAQQMIDEHTKVNQQLMDLASRKQVTLPRAVEAKDRAAFEALSGLRRGEFDREFVKQQYASHICSVQLFKAEAERGQDPDLKQFASQILPNLQDHLKMVRGMVKDDGTEGAQGGAHRTR